MIKKTLSRIPRKIITIFKETSKTVYQALLFKNAFPKKIVEIISHGVKVKILGFDRVLGVLGLLLFIHQNLGNKHFDTKYKCSKFLFTKFNLYHCPHRLERNGLTDRIQTIFLMEDYGGSDAIFVVYLVPKMGIWLFGDDSFSKQIQNLFTIMVDSYLNRYFSPKLPIQSFPLVVLNSIKNDFVGKNFGYWMRTDQKFDETLAHIARWCFAWMNSCCNDN
ncbi:hypothetical protein BpHYR1_044461 [Brachionus plicatilis]|uniref:Uncharacterized protein n=1 Tax=Brachionus plicatilis TaxID=10195 RepID=A0A3M7P519_BRAPC|nr:hypothetical protein BpHYR1_044461 [Brachionus plicatilis]